MATQSESILILTPVKNAARFLDSYFRSIAGLTYPASLISLGFLESDSTDDTYERLAGRLDDLRKHYAGAELWRRDFNFQIPNGLPRWTRLFKSRGEKS
jgi:Anp1